MCVSVCHSACYICITSPITVSKAVCQSKYVYMIGQSMFL